MGTAMATMYIFFIGGFGGGVISGFLVDAVGVRGTVLVLGVPSAIIGGLLLINGARFIRNDLSLVVEELLEEQEEYNKRNREGADIPVLQLANVDFSYGPVQVLFGVNFEVHKGETLALLGTNGAGKSTVLRVISGLAVPERGVVRLGGRNITYVSPESARPHPRDHAAPGRQGRVPQPDDRPEPGGERAPRTRARTRTCRPGSTACTSCSPSSRSGASRWRRACRVASNRCSRSRACSSTIPRS